MCSTGPGGSRPYRRRPGRRGIAVGWSPRHPATGCGAGLLSYGAIAFGLVDLVIFLYPLGYVAVWPAVTGTIIVGFQGR